MVLDLVLGWLAHQLPLIVTSRQALHHCPS